MNSNDELNDIMNDNASYNDMNGNDVLNPVYKIQINYHSGKTREFWATSFERDDNGQYTWGSVDNSNKPLLLGVDQFIR